MKGKGLSLMEAGNNEAVTLQRDNKDFKSGNREFWILSDGYEVTIHEQRVGEASTQGVTLPRSVFNRMVKFYTEPQKTTR